jgi:hypothetical protein
VSNKKAQNGAGSVERRGATWWVRVSAPGMPRKRVPIAESEKMTELRARKAGARLAADVRAARIVFDEKPRKGALPSPVTTVRQLGEAWTSGELLRTHGAVNRLRVKATAATDGWTMAKHVYGVHTRGPAGPVFGDLAVAQVTSDDVSAVMASHSMALAGANSHAHLPAPSTSLRPGDLPLQASQGRRQPGHALRSPRARPREALLLSCTPPK